jgi:hypothetical protein
MRSGIGTNSPFCGRAEHGSSTQVSDLNSLRDIKRIVDLDAEVAHRALNLGVAQEQLIRAQVASAPIDKGGLSPAHGMRGVLERVQPDAADPLADKPSVLACRQMQIRAPTAREQALAKSSAADPKVVVQCLPGYI